MKIDINNHTYFVKTFGQFNFCKTPISSPDYISESGSQYWYTEKGLIRQSDHWGIVCTCRWFLNEKKSKKINENTTAFCSWKTMKHINILDCASLSALNLMPKKMLQKISIKTSFGTYKIENTGNYGARIVSKDRITEAYSYGSIRIIIN